MKAAMRFVPFVEVQWRDSHTPTTTAWRNWAEVKQYHNEPCKCSTVGFLVRSDKRGVTLAMSVTDGGLFGGLWHVPRGLIIRTLRLRRSSRKRG